MSDAVYFALNGLLLGLSVGALLGMRIRDGYWVRKAYDGTRAAARGQLYFVIEAPASPKRPRVR